MRRILIIALFAASFAVVAAAGAAEKDELVIYTYDSLVAKGGLGPEIFPVFEKKCGCKIRALPSGDAGQLITRLQLDAERAQPTAQIVLGIDQQIWSRAKPFIEEWGDWKPKNYSSLVSSFKVEKGFLPYDYGVFAFMADEQSLQEKNLIAPKKIIDLLKPEWKRNIILEDPRTSTPGLAFLLYTQKVMGNSAWDFWKNFRSQWSTLAGEWDGAYGLFMKKEAPLVWSYTTSQAYHQEHGDKPGPKKRYRAILFDEGQPFQIEGAAFIKDALRTPKQKKLARMFMDFIISPEVQKKIPQKNWMFPVVKNIPLPKSFKEVPRPKKLVTVDSKSEDTLDTLSKWNQAIAGSL